MHNLAYPEAPRKGAQQLTVWLRVPDALLNRLKTAQALNGSVDPKSHLLNAVYVILAPNNSLLRSWKWEGKLDLSPGRMDSVGRSVPRTAGARSRLLPMGRSGNHVLALILN